MASGSRRGLDIMQTAEEVWGALDKMMVTDPEGYKKFIKQQMEEGKEVMASPEPVMCLRCGLEGVSEGERGMVWCRMGEMPMQGGLARVRVR